MQVNGKDYTFKYLSADVFIKARKPLRVVDECIKKITMLDEAEGEAEAIEKLGTAWKEFCDLVFDGEKPYDASVADIIGVAAGFFGQAVGGVQK